MSENDERAAFEAWFDNRPDEYGFLPDAHPVREDGTYEWGFKQEMWECWRARATAPLTDMQRRALSQASNGHALEWEEMSALAEIINEWGIR